MNDSLPRQTPLTGRHEALAANMANFAGYRMPLWYPTGARKEHLSVICAAGLFDTSHMAVVGVSGSGARALLQRCFTKDLAACIGPQHHPLLPGRSVYGAFLSAEGHVIDDAIVFCAGWEDFLVVVNAGMGPHIARHLKGCHDAGAPVVITDFTDRLGKIDIQGPMAARILSHVIDTPTDVFKGMVYFSFKGHFDADHPAADGVRFDGGHPALLSRTGYTGEFGFELFMDAGRAGRFWDALLSAGKPYGLTPCGLAARDSLRAGAMLPLSHQDIGHWPFVNHPWPFALPWNEDRTTFTKPFIGDGALISAGDGPHTYAFAGKDLRKVTTADGARALDSRDRRIGTVLTCVTDMAIDRVGARIVSVASPDRAADFTPRGLCCGFIKVDRPLAPESSVTLEDNHRRVAVTIVDDVRPDRSARRPITQMQ
ncbi:MAG: aminomethyltransferase family protein [Pseudomonadota bacterium]